MNYQTFLTRARSTDPDTACPSSLLVGGDINFAAAALISAIKDEALFCYTTRPASVIVASPLRISIDLVSRGLYRHWVDWCEGWGSPNLFYAFYQKFFAERDVQGDLQSAGSYPIPPKGKLATLISLVAFSESCTVALRTGVHCYHQTFVQGVPQYPLAWARESGSYAFRLALKLDPAWVAAQRFRKDLLEAWLRDGDAMVHDGLPQL